jgi:protein-tyrosine-phosphatase
MSRRFDVAFVCTGNRFRSVLAAAAFAAAASDDRFRAESYGTLDLGPAEPLPGAVREARALGLEVSSHRARCLTDADLEDANLVVGFELAHVVAAVEVAGARVERTFVLPELADLLAADDPPFEGDAVAAADTRIRKAHVLRSNGRRRTITEIRDPVSLPAAAQTAVARSVVEGTQSIARRLAGEIDG